MQTCISAWIGEAAGREPLDHAGLGRRRHLADLAPAIGEEAERTRRRDRRVELAQRARRRVARVGEDLPAGRLLPLVEREEGGFGHVDLAAHLADRRHALAAQLVRDVGERPHVGVTSSPSVPSPRGRARQAAALVAQRTGQAVDLRLGGEGDLLVLRQAQEPAHALDELPHLVVVEGIAEREHRHRVSDLGELRGRLRADPARGRIGADEIGKRASISSPRCRSAS